MVSHVRLKPIQDVTLARVDITLTVDEIVWDDQANESEKQLLKQTLSLAKDLAVAADELLLLEEPLTIPDDGPWTLAAPDSRVEWKVGVEITLEGYGPRWTAERTLLVLP